MIASGTTSDNEWQQVATSGALNDNEWQRETTRQQPFRLIFLFSNKRGATTKHPNENSLNIEEDLWRKPIELRAETSP